MAFTDKTKSYVNEYVRNHLASDDWHFTFFNFIDDDDLALRLGEEFLAARVIYKLLEGMEAEEWLQRAQIRLQILAYASIYEASLHHLLFVVCSGLDEVRELTAFSTRKPFSIPKTYQVALEKHLSHDGRTVIPTYVTTARTDQTKVRFDRKAECACSVGIIEPWLKDELIVFYEARNSIHIHAEIRKGLQYELDLSKRAYRRMQPFKEQVSNWQRKTVLGAS